MYDASPTLRPWLWLSATLHALAMATVVVVARSGSAEVLEQEQALIATAEATRQAQVASEAAADHQALAESAAAGIRAELDAALDGALSDSPDLDGALDRTLSDLFAQHELEGLDVSAAERLQNEARNAAFARLDQLLATQLRQTLVAEVRAHIATETVPELTARIADEVSRRLAPALRATAAISGTAAVLAAQPALTAAVAESLTSTAVPQVARQLSERVLNRLRQLDEDPAQFRALVETEVRQALTAAINPSASAAVQAALAATDRSMPQPAPGREAVIASTRQAAGTLRRLAQEQGELRAKVADPAADADLTQQRALAAAMAQAAADARAATRAVRLSGAASDQTGSRLDQALSAMPEPDAAARAAAQTWQAGAVEETRSSMDTAISGLERSASALEQAAQTLASASDRAPISSYALNPAMADNAAREAARNAAQGLPQSPVLGDTSASAKLAKARGTLRQLAATASTGRVPLATDLAGAGGFLTGRGNSARTRFNRAAYEAFVKDLRARAAPGSAYEEHVAPTGLEARTALPAVAPPPLWIPPLPATTSAPAETRTLAPPTFPHAAFGGAVYQATPLTIDGDLSDWGPLTQPLTMAYRNDGTPLKDHPPAVYLRWNASGLWFAWTRQVTTITASPRATYRGDVMEVFLDCANSRLSTMYQAEAAHQFVLMPFGYQGNSEVTFCESGREHRGLRMFQPYFDPGRIRGFAKGRQIPGGYAGEGFIAVGALARPSLVPGQYLALNVSMNTGEDDRNDLQWSAPKAIQTWDKPDTWGDVVLLGSDASLRFADPAAPDKDAACAAIGWPLMPEVKDPDMDLDRKVIDRIAVEVTGADDAPVLAVLGETGPSSGVFRGSVAVDHALNASASAAVPARPGGSITLRYRDPRAAYGERQRLVTRTIMVGVPVGSAGDISRKD